MNWPPHTASIMYFHIIEAVWAHLDREQKSANVQRRALDVLEEDNYSWRLLKKLHPSLPKRAQAALKNKLS